MDSAAECRVVRAGQSYEGKQALAYGGGISAESAGSRGPCLHTSVIPPHGRGKAHLHEDHDSATYVIEGAGEMWWGEGLAHHEVVEAGDFVYIPAGVTTSTRLSAGPRHHTRIMVRALNRSATELSWSVTGSAKEPAETA